MKKVYALVFLIAIVGCSKEKKQQIAENLVLKAMTDGQWKVTGFVKGSSNITSSFSSYKFQFKSNLTVDAINNSVVEKTGSWNADPNAQSITSNFVNATDPLIYLNGTWHINQTTWTSVNATQTVGSEVWTLQMDKL